MKEWVGRLIAYVFVGSFCIAGPLALILALGTAAQRAGLLIYGQHAQATVIGAQQSRSSPTAYAPVFRFTAADGRSYTASSDLYGKETAVRFGERIQILYWPRHPESARIDAFGPLWTMPIVVGVVGAGFCVVPAMILVAWMRRRAGALAPERQEAARVAADKVSRGFQRALGLVLIAAGGALLVSALGFAPSGHRIDESPVLVTAIGVLLVSCGVLVGQWVGPSSLLSRVLGSVLASAMAVMLGWVAVEGNSANFHGGIGVGAVSVGMGGSAIIPRIAFGLASLLAGLAALRAWKQVLRPR